MTGPHRLDREIDEELSFHVEGLVDELVGDGWDRDTAEAEALRRFGDVDRLRDACREERRRTARKTERRGMMTTWWVDLRIGAKELVRDRGLAVLVVAVLGLGVGFATALFSAVEGALLRELPYPEADRLAYVWQNDRATGTEREPAGSADFFDFRERSQSFAELTMWTFAPGNLLREGADPLHVRLARVRPDLDDVLGVAPAVGRFVAIDEAVGSGAPVAVLTWDFWQAAFDADRDVVGRVVTLDGVGTEIVGVMPDGWAAALTQPVDAVVPLAVTAGQASRNPHAFVVAGRLADGVPLERARAELGGIAARLEDEVPANANGGAFVESVDAFVRGDSRGVLLALLGAVGVLLLLACLNVANLLLARSIRRTRETAVHTALGADVARTARRNLAAAGLLMAGAAGLALAVAWGALRIMESLAPDTLYVLGGPSLNLTVLAFALAVCGTLAVAFGAVPTLGARRLDLQRALGHGADDAGGRGAGLRRGLVVAQAALASALLVAALLLTSTVRNLSGVDLGFRTDRVLHMTFALPSTRYPVDFSVYPRLPERLAFMDETLRRLGEVPGVEAAALTTNHSLDPGFTNSIAIEGRPPDPERGEPTTRMVTPGYFEVAGVQLMEGRFFRADEGVDAPGVVLLNRTAADAYFPDGDALGARIGFWGQGFREVVGIVADERVSGAREAAPPAFYTSLLQTPPATGELRVMVRARTDPLLLSDPVRRAIWSVDPALAIRDVATMDATRAGQLRRERFAALVLQVFAGMAGILAALGLYGVASHAVARRARELGIRIALGADRPGLAWRVVRQGLTPVVVGLGVGLLIARLFAGALGGLLFGVEPGAPGPYVVAAALLLAASVAATLLPARRAASVEPAAFLRNE
ncbi:MAG: ADOP family duplicated permease [Longimicrobiales bacterium]